MPTGIVTVELSPLAQRGRRACPACRNKVHDRDALYCKRCGAPLVGAE